MSITRVPPAPYPRPSRSARDWAAAKAEYLAGAEAEAVCRRHDIRTAYFLRIAGEQGWRRPDPEPAPAAQAEPLVIPDAPPGASRDGAEAPALLTAAQMADKAWAMVSAAVAAGQLIQTRGWLRLYEELQPFAREQAEAERRARMDREAAIALPLHCFSPPECNVPSPGAASPCHPGNAAGGIRDGTARQTLGPGRRPIRATGSVTQAALRPARPDGCTADLAPDAAIAPPLHCFSPPGCNSARPAAAPGHGDAVALQLHCFSRPESRGAGPDP